MVVRAIHSIHLTSLSSPSFDSLFLRHSMQFLNLMPGASAENSSSLHTMSEGSIEASVALWVVSLPPRHRAAQFESGTTNNAVAVDASAARAAALRFQEGMM